MATWHTHPYRDAESVGHSYGKPHRFSDGMSEMVPRITVGDDDDRDITISALVHHMARTVGGALLTGDVLGMVQIVRRLTDMVETLVIEAGESMEAPEMSDEDMENLIQEFKNGLEEES